ncbi:MAG: hypothetical protein GY842_05730 [bacterium]|nr:hypothetical protein [bacterium]
MAVDNPVVKQLISAISPIISIGVGSAICTVCKENGLSPDALEPKDVPMMREELVTHYQKLWANQADALQTALATVA